MPNYSKNDVAIHGSLVIKLIGKLADVDAEWLEKSLRGWLGF